MSPTSELEQTLEQLISVHQELAGTLSRHTKAMSAMDLAAMERLALVVQQQRQAISILEQRRMQQMQAVARQSKIDPKATLRELAEAIPLRQAALMSLRDRLGEAVRSVQAGGVVASRLSGAVVGHLNTALRLLSAAVNSGGTYTRSGHSPPPGRLGLVEAVG